MPTPQSISTKMSANTWSVISSSTRRSSPVPSMGVQRSLRFPMISIPSSLVFLLCQKISSFCFPNFVRRLIFWLPPTVFPRDRICRTAITWSITIFTGIRCESFSGSEESTVSAAPINTFSSSISGRTSRLMNTLISRQRLKQKWRLSIWLPQVTTICWATMKNPTLNTAKNS